MPSEGYVQGWRGWGARVGDGKGGGGGKKIAQYTTKSTECLHLKMFGL